MPVVDGAIGVAEPPSVGSNASGLSPFVGATPVPYALQLSAISLPDVGSNHALISGSVIVSLSSWVMYLIATSPPSRNVCARPTSNGVASDQNL